jgi:hypothetical protein
MKKNLVTAGSREPYVLYLASFYLIGSGNCHAPILLADNYHPSILLVGVHCPLYLQRKMNETKYA